MSNTLSSEQNPSSQLAAFLWLLEDWQGCKQELRRIVSDGGLASITARILEELVRFEQQPTDGINIKDLIKAPVAAKTLRKFLLVSIEKKLLRSKALLGEKVRESNVSKALRDFTNEIPTQKTVKLLTTVIEAENLQQQPKEVVSIDSWLSNYKAASGKYGESRIVEIEQVLNLLDKTPKQYLQTTRFLADCYMESESFTNAIRLYSELIEQTSLNETLALRLARAKKNTGSNDQAIDIVEEALSVLGRKPSLLHNLAVYYRDNQNFKQSINLVHEVIANHFDYSLKINFATFAADMLRKNAQYTLAYKHLKQAATVNIDNGGELSLTATAMLAELKSNVESKATEWYEVSSVFYDTIYKNSNKYALEAEDSIYEPVWKEVVKILRDSNIENVVDIGCGPGQFAEYLTKALPSVKYLGLDFSKTAIAIAKQRCPDLTFKCEDVRNYTSQTSDSKTAYIMLEVLEHIEDDKALLNILPKDSLILFSVPNFDSFGHVRFFSDEGQALNRFKIIKPSLNINPVFLNHSSIIYLLWSK